MDRGNEKLRVVGISHICIKLNNAKCLFNPNKFKKCPNCNEDLTNKPMIILDVGKTVEVKKV